MTTIRNRVQLVGNLGMDPEIKNYEGNKKLAKFTVATNEKTTVNGEVKTDTQWHNVVAFGKMAEIVEKQLQKGAEVALEGKIRYSNYEDKSGARRYYTEIIANDFIVYPGERKKAEN